MFKRYVIITGLLMASSALAENDLSTLNGYQGHFASPAFTALLKEDEEVFAYFEEHSVELQKVLADANLQAKLVNGEVTVDELTETLAEQFAASQQPLPNAEARAAQDLAKSLNARSTQVSGAVSGGAQARAARDLGGVSRDGATVKPVDTTPGPRDVAAGEPPLSLFDLNKVPEGGLDARGWPKYLKVPASCDAPKEGIKYGFTPGQWFKLAGPDGQRTIPARPREENGNSFEISHYLGGPSWGWRRHQLADDEVQAIPFITSAVVGTRLVYSESYVNLNAFNQSPLFARVELGSESAQPDIFAISRCPGDLNPKPENGFRTAQGSVFNAADYEAKLAEAKELIRTRGHSFGLYPLKAETQYFLNIGFKNPNQCEQNWLDVRPIARDSRGKAICSHTIGSSQNSGFQYRPPYTGPCLSQAPYPMNYDSINCQGSNAYQNAPTGAGSVDLVNGSMKYRCFDPKGELPETRYEMKVVNGLVRWVQGGGKPAPARLICASSAEADWDALPIHEICSRRTEGYRQSVQVLGYGGYPVKRQITQCMKDSAQGNAFAWKLLVGDDMGPMGVGGFMQASSNHMVITRYLDAEGNELTRHAQGDGRTGVNEGTVIDPRWDDPTVSTASLKPGQ